MNFRNFNKIKDRDLCIIYSGNTFLKYEKTKVNSYKGRHSGFNKSEIDEVYKFIKDFPYIDHFHRLSECIIKEDDKVIILFPLVLLFDKFAIYLPYYEGIITDHIKDFFNIYYLQAYEDNWEKDEFICLNKPEYNHTGYILTLKTEGKLCFGEKYKIDKKPILRENLNRLKSIIQSPPTIYHESSNERVHSSYNNTFDSSKESNFLFSLLKNFVIFPSERVPNTNFNQDYYGKVDISNDEIIIPENFRYIDKDLKHE
jgi:hypothetical protein